MKRTLVVLGLAALVAAPSAAQLKINEIDYDQIGTDAAEFVEIYNSGDTPIALNGFFLELVNGAGGGAVVYRTIPLPADSLDPGEFFVVCGNATNVPNCDLDVTPDTDLVQNGAPDAVALRPVANPTAFEDTVSYEGSTTGGYTEAIGTTAADSNTVAGSLVRCPDGEDTDNNDADFIFAGPISPGTANIGCPSTTPMLTIADVAVIEGDVGTVDAVFTVSLSLPAEPGGVTFDIATQDDTATVGDGDYESNSLTGQSIPEGEDEYTFVVTVNGDFTVEPDERFVVNVTNVVGATVGDGVAFGTITNDELVLTAIHDIQGPGSSSPIPGAVVTTRGIVTAVKTNGFFVQAPDAEADADPLTSEGILVFTSSAPPAAAAVGNRVQVTGTVAEFVPTADPLQPPLTELTTPTVSLLETGLPLPTAVPLSASFPDPAGAHDQLERHEGMRVSVASFTVWGPTLGGVNETNATATTNGVLYGTVTGNARPVREAGIQAPDPPPQGSIPPIPRFDSNPESIRVDTDSAGHSPLDVGAGAILGGLAGPLDFAFRKHTIALEASTVVTVDGGPAPTAVAAATPLELTVAAYNLQRFFDDFDDAGISEPVLTPAAYASRLARASLGLRDYLRYPDVVGIVECEKLGALQDLADQINADAGPSNPLYVPYLVEGNDVGGIDVGFLVKTAAVSGTVPRVEVGEVVQERAGTLFTNPDNSTELLNDRPTLRFTGVVNFPSGQSYPLTVMVNHLRSLNGVASLDPGPNGWPTTGERVRAKRLAQAVDLADLVQDRQVDDPAEHAILVGDFNAFEVNDGLVHSIGVILGAPVPDDETAVPGDGVDLVTPDLARLGGPGDHSYVFDGNAQSLDHALVNAPLVASTAERRLEHPRINADFPETARNVPGTVERLSDHDPLVVYLRPATLDPDLAFRGDFESGDTRWWSAEVP